MLNRLQEHESFFYYLCSYMCILSLGFFFFFWFQPVTLAQEITKSEKSLKFMKQNEKGFFTSLFKITFQLLHHIFKAFQLQSLHYCLEFNLNSNKFMK